MRTSLTASENCVTGTPSSSSLRRVRRCEQGEEKRTWRTRPKSHRRTCSRPWRICDPSALRSRRGGRHVQLGEDLERLVGREGHVGREHHEGLGALVLVLDRSRPLAEAPLLVVEQLKVVVREGRRGEGPGALEPGAVGVAAA